MSHYCINNEIFLDCLDCGTPIKVDDTLDTLVCPKCKIEFDVEYDESYDNGYYSLERKPKS
jgi:DNA-directed RNA polymerase subunit M/transcription elongation factor TFIIS